MTEEHTHDENCNHDEGTPFEMAPPELQVAHLTICLLYTSPSPRD